MEYNVMSLSQNVVKKVKMGYKLRTCQYLDNVMLIVALDFSGNTFNKMSHGTEGGRVINVCRT